MNKTDFQLVIGIAVQKVLSSTVQEKKPASAPKINETQVYVPDQESHKSFVNSLFAVLEK